VDCVRALKFILIVGVIVWVFCSSL
jgi:hypothetical protein